MSDFSQAVVTDAPFDQLRTGVAQQSIPPRPFGVSLLDTLKAGYRELSGNIAEAQQDLATRGKVIDILIRHPEFEEFVFLLKNIEG